jgi:[acyl-carrier-protein] S-malonyltransferase
MSARKHAAQIVAVFPGQGSQSVGMGKFLFENFTLAKTLFEEASDALSFNFKKLCFEGPESELQLTHNTQPALVLISTITHRVLISLVDCKILAGAGHSVGEYSACVAAGVFPMTAALKSVRLRGQAMQEAVPVGQGAMLAVLGLTDLQAIELCKIAQEKSKLRPIEPANFNAPGQVVLSGSKAALDWLKDNFAADWLGTEPVRAKFIPLNVSAPFHCSLMLPAEEKMRHVLNDIKLSNALWPVVQNVSAKAEAEFAAIKENLIQQVSRSVRWTDCYRELLKSYPAQIIELGSGKVLAGLAKKIAPDTPLPLTINTLDDLKSVERFLTQAPEPTHES